MTHIIHSLEAIKNLLDDICMRIRHEEAEIPRVENVVAPQQQKRPRSKRGFEREWQESLNHFREDAETVRVENVVMTKQVRNRLGRPMRPPLKDLSIEIVNMMREPTSETLDRIWCDPDDYTKIFQPDEFRDAFVSAGLSETYAMIISHEMHHSTRARILRLAIRGLRPDLIQRLCDEASTCVDDSEYEA